MEIDLSKNTVVCGDNLEWLNWISDGSVDLCYIDPPFFSNRNYEIIWGNGYETRSFGDRFSGGIKRYIEWMEERIKIIHCKLKNSGAIFLHCDTNANHRLRVSLDEIFGEQNFKNQISWKRCDSHNDSKKQFSAVTDTILFYQKTNAFSFNIQYTNHAEKTLKEWYQYLELPDGTTRKMTKEENNTQVIPEGARRFNTGDLSSPNPRKNLMYLYKEHSHPKNGWRVDQTKMADLDKQNKLLFPVKKTGRIMKKNYLDEQNGAVVGDCWLDVDFIRGNDCECCGYKTQKPEELIKRIIECSSKEGDIILDCFGGGGTTAKVAVDLKRKFITGDVSPVAVKIMSERLSKNGFQDFETKNIPCTIEEFISLNPHSFAELICEVQGWEVNPKKSGEGGIDGWAKIKGERIPVQVKNQQNPTGRPDIQKFHSAITTSKCNTGIFVSWEYSSFAVERIVELKKEHGIEITAMHCSEILKNLIIDAEKRKELNQYYTERFPENWKKLEQSA